MKDGVKDCSKCNLPHSEKGYDYVIGFLKDNIRGYNDK